LLLLFHRQKQNQKSNHVKQIKKISNLEIVAAQEVHVVADGVESILPNEKMLETDKRMRTMM